MKAQRTRQFEFLRKEASDQPALTRNFHTLTLKPFTAKPKILTLKLYTLKDEVNEIPNARILKSLQPRKPKPNTSQLTSYIKQRTLYTIPFGRVIGPCNPNT